MPRPGTSTTPSAHTTGQLLLVLDADHVPQPDILDATVGYFDDPSVALVQTPHDFGNHDSFQHFETGRHDQSMFFEVIMPGKDRHDGAFWCGSAALILRHALEGIGGIATETVAEDFHTTIRLHGQGWHTRYHDETLVQGLAPHDLATFLLQRDRWARGNLAVLRTPENPVVARRLTVKQRVSYLSSLLAYFVPLQRLGMLAVLVAMLVSGRLPAARHAVAVLRLLAAVDGPRPAGARRPSCAGAGQPVGRGLLDPADHRDLRPGRLRAGPPVPHLVQGHPEGRDRRRRLAGRPPAPPGAGHGLRCWPPRSSPAVLAAGRPGPPPPAPRAGPGGRALPSPAWELFVVAAALRRVTRRRQVRHHYRVPVEVAGVVDGTLVRVVDLTPGGAGVIGPHAIDGGHRGRPPHGPARGVDGDIRAVRVSFTVCSCRRPRASGGGWAAPWSRSPRPTARRSSSTATWSARGPD